MTPLRLDTALQYLKGVGPRRAEALGRLGLRTVEDLLYHIPFRYLDATSVSPIVRLHKSFAHLIPGILDQGIMGIQVSEVETAQEARAIVRLAKYPPIGNRGISGQGPHTGYKSYGARHATEYPKPTRAGRLKAATSRAVPSGAARGWVEI